MANYNTLLRTVSIGGLLAVAFVSGNLVSSAVSLCPSISQQTLLLATTAAFQQELSKLSLVDSLPPNSCKIMDKDTFPDKSSTFFGGCTAEFGGVKYKYGIGYANNGAFQQSSMVH
jgi:hypothetical protein